MTGRMSQDKGKRAERDLANWWKTHGYPGAGRAVKTGDRFTKDGGDLILAWPIDDNGIFRLVCEVKHHAGGISELQVAQFGAKLLEQVRVSGGTMGVLIERRDRTPDPGRWWVHLHALDFAALAHDRVTWLGGRLSWVPVRCSVAYLAELLTEHRLAGPWAGVVSSATSPPDGAAQLAVTAMADGVSP